MMKQIIINFYKKKKTKSLLKFIGILTLGIILIFTILNSETVNVKYLILFSLIAIAGFIGTIKFTLDILGKSKMGLKINDNGLLFLGTSSSRKVGEIKWVDIEQITEYNAYGIDNYFVKLKEPKKYIQNKSNNEMLNSGIMINASELEISYEELGKLINDYRSNLS